MDHAQAFFFAHPFWAWMAIGGVFLIAELMTGSGWLLWPAGAAADVARVSRLSRLHLYEPVPYGWVLPTARSK